MSKVDYIKHYFNDLGENLYKLGNAIDKDILSPCAKTLKNSNLNSIQDLKNITLTILKTGNDIIEKFIMHYPYVTTIALIATTTLSVLSLSLVGLILNGLFLLKYGDHIITTIRNHSENNISELSSSYEDKRNQELLIKGSLKLQKIGNWFKQKFNY